MVIVTYGGYGRLHHSLAKCALMQSAITTIGDDYQCALRAYSQLDTLLLLYYYILLLRPLLVDISAMQSRRP